MADTTSWEPTSFISSSILGYLLMKWAMNGAMTEEPIIGGTPTDNLPALSSCGDSISSFSWVNPLMSSSILGSK